ncbi:hypothetical protein BAUCODRAFT_121243 [Baudoinia panamericana UAMH 10762]|uniref:F-box domain-containing protein n=1 Tax=Baudoinia panamericana (strain UAMH 10762) TaxID=717646 RepID=M2N335_BAUPA|nr:uncharacterized protein BAUCODRAFT_121243 [Baudoinia panamericana UAMH 10762]EMC98368.1 hypothetical protein BAUCODRAFT_121243 [Baudoinia panamericana UAMH 10762]
MARATSSGRVAKRRSATGTGQEHNGMSTRLRSRLATEATSASGSKLQEMVDEVCYMSTTGESEPPSEHDAMDEDVDGHMAYMEGLEVARAGKRKALFEDKQFPLMQLPAEIRNEIYRACLTRPFNILLSKKEQPRPAPRPQQDEVDADARIDISPSSTGMEDDEIAGSSSQSRSATRSQPTGPSIWSNRHTRPMRVTRLSARQSSAGATATIGRGLKCTTRAHRRVSLPPLPLPPPTPRPQAEDPLVVNLLRVSKTVYQEARSVLYSENHFNLDLATAPATLATLHQRSRRQIRHVEVGIPSYNEILDRFQETVRLSLRYCWGLRKMVIYMPFSLPTTDGNAAPTNTTTVYANGFDILRWLPRQCEVDLRGSVSAEVEAVVSKNANLAKTLDELAYARRQLISNEGDRSPG